jgi:hypothetical protein
VKKLKGILGSYRASLGVVHGEDDDEVNFFFVKNFNFYYVSGGVFCNFSVKIAQKSSDFKESNST